MLPFPHLLTPIYSSIKLYLDIPKENLCKPEMKEFIGLFAEKIQGLIIYKNEKFFGSKHSINFSEFHEHYSNHLKNLRKICIDNVMAQQVWNFFILKRFDRM